MTTRTDFDLHCLGWHSFQQLCLTICREILGQTVESFLDSNDGGRDGAFCGKWRKTSHEEISGQFVIQCKHTSKKGKNLTYSDLGDELEKAARLVSKRRCDAYILITNAGVSGESEEKISSALKSVGVKHVLIFGKTWVCDQIRQSKRLRMFVPRVYGLGDLSQILDERRYKQARELLDSLREDMAKIVITGSYRRAATALQDHGFVLLIGEPAAGKTTIAALLSISALDHWGASPMKLDTPESIVTHWNTEEPSQFFWVDDAFGATQYDAQRARDWNSKILEMKAILRQGKKIVLTSRDYIYNSAREDLKESAFPLFKESQVVIDVHDLTKLEKEQILYNHIKLGNQPKEFIQDIKPFLESIADHERFVPETARRLADPVFTSELQIDQASIDGFVNDQRSFLLDTLSSLDSDSKAALALIYIRAGRLVSPVRLNEIEHEAAGRLRSDAGGISAALRALDGSFVQLAVDEGEKVWRFRHPTIGDAFAQLLISNPELLDIYLQGTDSNRLIRQITCGDVGFQGAIVVQNSLFNYVADRLEQHTEESDSRWEAKGDIQLFLAWRCSKNFLKLYIARHPSILGEVIDPGLYLHAMDSLKLAIRLHEVGLLPEQHRRKLVKKVSQYAIEGRDLYALTNKQLRSILTKDEQTELRSRIKLELLPRLSSIMEEEREQYEYNADDEYRADFMRMPNELLEGLWSEFRDKKSRQIVRDEKDVMQTWIDEDERFDDDKFLRDSRFTEPEHSVGQSETRSIFDDIDQ